MVYMYIERFNQERNVLNNIYSTVSFLHIYIYYVNWFKCVLYIKESLYAFPQLGVFI